jgi:3-methyl-2-oxobutanoate hydroxymethyltransferase
MEEALWPTGRRNTIYDLASATERGEKWAMLTSYDVLTAHLFEEAGVRALLVGDTCGQVIFGASDTVSVTMDQMIPIVQAVVRGTSRALVVADLPFGSYQSGPQAALTNGVRQLKEGGAQAVKLEGGRVVVPQIRALVGAGVPVMGHLGMTPQTAGMLGGVHRVQGRGEAGDRLLQDALDLEAAGAFAIVLEAVPASLAKRVSEELRVPTVGIGAGPDCDAQILVWQDMAGLTEGPAPRFVKRFGAMATDLRDAAASYAHAVLTHEYPDQEHSYL